MHRKFIVHASPVLLSLIQIACGTGLSSTEDSTQITFTLGDINLAIAEVDHYYINEVDHSNTASLATQSGAGLTTAGTSPLSVSGSGASATASSIVSVASYSNTPENYMDTTATLTASATAESLITSCTVGTTASACTVQDSTEFSFTFLRSVLSSLTSGIPITLNGISTTFPFVRYTSRRISNTRGDTGNDILPTSIQNFSVAGTSDGIYFVAYNSPSTSAVYRYSEDLTSGSSVRKLADLNSPTSLTYNGVELYFSAFQGSSPNKSKLMKFTPGQSVVTQVSDTYPGDHDGAARFAFKGSDLYFKSKLSPGIYKLFKYDGTSVTQVSSTRPSYNEGNSAVISEGGFIYFSSENASGNTKLYRTNGSTIEQISNLNASASDGVTAIAALNSQIYFIGLDASAHRKLFRFSPTSGVITQLSNILSAYHDIPQDSLVAFGNSIYFQGYEPGGNYSCGYRYNAETGELTQLTDFVTDWDGDSAAGFTGVGEHLYFHAFTASDSGLGESISPRIFEYNPEANRLAQLTDHDSKIVGTANDKLYYAGKTPEGYWKLYEMSIEEIE